MHDVDVEAHPAQVLVVVGALRSAYVLGEVLADRLDQDGVAIALSCRPQRSLFHGDRDVAHRGLARRARCRALGALAGAVDEVFVALEASLDIDRVGAANDLANELGHGGARGDHSLRRLGALLESHRAVLGVGPQPCLARVALGPCGGGEVRHELVDAGRQLGVFRVAQLEDHQREQAAARGLGLVLLLAQRRSLELPTRPRLGRLEDGPVVGLELLEPRQLGAPARAGGEHENAPVGDASKQVFECRLSVVHGHARFAGLLAAMQSRAAISPAVTEKPPNASS